MKKILLIICFVLLLPAGALAASFHISGDEKTEIKEEEGFKNLYTAANDISVNGPVEGDLVATGMKISVNNHTSNDIFAAGGEINLNSEVGNNARLVGDIIRIDSKIKNDLLTAGSEIDLSDNASIGDDLILIGKNIQISGVVGRNVHIYGGDVVISGKIGGNVVAKHVKSLKIEGSAQIDGSLVYSSVNKAQVDNGAKITGITEYQKIKRGFLASIWIFVARFISTLAFGIVIIYLFPKTSKKIVEKAYLDSAVSGLIGLLVLVLVPISIIPLTISAIGLKLAIFLIFGYIALCLLAAAYLPVVLGAGVLKYVFRQKEYELTWVSAGLGVLILILLSFLRQFATPVVFFMFVISFGSLIKILYLKTKEGLR